MFGIATWVFLFIFTYWFYHLKWKRLDLPPGPIPLPFYGNYLQMFYGGFTSAYDVYQSYAKKYGPVYTLWFGDTAAVIVTDYKLIRELFVSQGSAYAGRFFLNPITKFLRGFDGTIDGVTKTQGEDWMHNRRYSLHTYRNLGMGQKRMEVKIVEEMEILENTIRAEKEKGIVDHKLRRLLSRFTGSTQNFMLLGRSLVEEKDVTEYLKVYDALLEAIRLFSTLTGNMLVTMPYLRYLPVFSQTFKEIDECMFAAKDYMDKIVEEKIAIRKMRNRLTRNRREHESHEEVDYIEMYLDRMEAEAAEHKKEGKEQEQQRIFYNHETLKHNVFDMFPGAGATDSMLQFMVLYLMMDQRSQNRLYKELCAYAIEKGCHGKDYVFSLNDRPKLPFAMAVIQETLRLCNVFPGNFAHKTMIDVQIGDHTLAEGTVIVPQISNVLYDENIFPEPDKFLPERFIEEKGNLKKSEEVIAFSVGKRACIGESLVRMTLFLFLTNFFYKFAVYPIDPMNQPTASQQKIPILVVVTKFDCLVEIR